MALRSSWKGFIKLSLVSVPVKAFTAANSGKEIRLNQLHEECSSRVKYKKVCPLHGELTKDDIVSGYEYDKGKYVVIDVDELDKLRTENDRSIHIQGFVEPDTLDARFYSGRTYYLTPDGPVGQKPYALLREGMLAQGKAAFAKVVISKREQIVLLRVIDNVLAMTVLHYNFQVKGLDAYKDEIAPSEIADEELNLTKMLIEASTIKEFEFDSYKDEYVDKLTELIQKKVEGEEIVQVPDPEKPKIVNLMDALKQSVAAVQGMEPESAKESKPASKSKAKTSKKKMAPSAKKKTSGSASQTTAKKSKKSKAV